jgi:hypothetical protein
MAGHGNVDGAVGLIWAQPHSHLEANQERQIRHSGAILVTIRAWNQAFVN